MTIEENLQNIENDFKAFSEKIDEFIEGFSESLDDLKKQIKAENTQEAPAGLWKPKGGERYYYLLDTGFIDYSISNNNDIEEKEERISIGNCYPTQQAAEKALEHKKIRRQLEEIAARLNKGRGIDFYELLPSKYFLYYDFANGEIKQWDYSHDKMQGTIYCIDENFKDAAIQEIGEDRLKEYLKEC